MGEPTLSGNRPHGRIEHLTEMYQLRRTNGYTDLNQAHSASVLITERRDYGRLAGGGNRLTGAQPLDELVTPAAMIRHAASGGQITGQAYGMSLPGRRIPAYG